MDDYEKYSELLHRLEHDPSFISSVATALEAISSKHAERLYASEYLLQAKDILSQVIYQQESATEEAMAFGKLCFSAGLAAATLIIDNKHNQTSGEVRQMYFDAEDRGMNVAKQLIEVKEKHSKGGRHSSWKPYEPLIIQHLEKYKIREFSSQEACCKAISEKTGLTLNQTTFSTWWKKYSKKQSIFK